jgi:hypothetical protein
MCGGEYEGGFRSGSWQRSRKERDCYACNETIRKGDLYHREVGRDDEQFFSLDHCARCWRMFIWLLYNGEGSSVRYDLNCGETYDYREEHGADPAYTLAFLTPDEAQAWAQDHRDKEYIERSGWDR